METSKTSSQISLNLPLNAAQEMDSFAGLARNSGNVVGQFFSDIDSIIVGGAQSSLASLAKDVKVLNRRYERSEKAKEHRPRKICVSLLATTLVVGLVASAILGIYLQCTFLNMNSWAVLIPYATGAGASIGYLTLVLVYCHWLWCDVDGETLYPSTAGNGMGACIIPLIWGPLHPPVMELTSKCRYKIAVKKSTEKVEGHLQSLKIFSESKEYTELTTAIEKDIHQLSSEIENAENGVGSYTTLNSGLEGKKARKAELETALEEINTTRMYVLQALNNPSLT